VETYEHRVVAGVLKSGAILDLAQVSEVLASDVAIVSDPSRAISTDLWPCIWALAAVLERQFSGKIIIDCGLTAPLPGPANLSHRCLFQSVPATTSLCIHVGLQPPFASYALWGDARGERVTNQRLLDGDCAAHPVACFALAGYLGFAALAQAVGIPPYREAFRTDQVHLPLSDPGRLREIELSIIGLGQLGQAYLALLYFLNARTGLEPSLVLIDKDIFEPPNRHTQVLLSEQQHWNGLQKATYLEQHVKTWGWSVRGVEAKITWTWKRPPQDPGLALLGLDKLEARRMAIAAGYEWIIDAGVGESFRQPRLSWHSVPPDNVLARQLFPDRHRQESLAALEGTALQRELMDTPGQCGWVTFQSVSAAAPAMGIAAAAYAVTELLNVHSGQRIPTQGRACLWSTMLPYYRAAIAPSAIL